jgi:fucose permease
MPLQVSLRVLFALMGFAFALWGVHVPSFKAVHGLSDGGVALGLLAVSVGAIASTFVAPRCLARFGAGRTVQVAGLLLGAGLAGALLPLPLGLLALLLVLLGIGIALTDVAVNSEAAQLEARSSRKQMSGFHALFSLGGMLGAGCGALLLHWAIDPLHQLAGMGLLLVLLQAWAAAGLPSLPLPAAHARWQLPRGLLLLLGVLAVIAFIVEGAMYDWSVLYLRQDTLASPDLAALGYASFSGAMAATRFAGDWARGRFSAALLLGGGALLAATALTAVLLLRDPVAGVIGLAFVGVGLANAVPLLFIAASSVPGLTAAQGIASVASMGYAALLVGPALVGGIAEFSSLTVALAALVPAALLLALGARRV